MRGKLTKAVLARFSEGVPARCPGFEPSEKSKDTLSWKRQIGESLFLFVEIGTSSKADHFLARVKWNQTDEWCSGVRDQPERPHGGVLLQNIRSFKPLITRWDPTGFGVWDVDPEYTIAWDLIMKVPIETRKWSDYPVATPIETVMPLVAPAVDDALSLLTEYGMPFLKRVAAAHNVAWPEDLAALY